MNHDGIARTSKKLHGTTSITGHMLQRKCACGRHTPGGGACAQCHNEEKLPQPLQTKLRIGEASDSYEQEADRVADQMVAMSEHSFVSAAAPRIQRLTRQPTGQSDAAPASVDRVLASSGRPLEPSLRKNMEQRFGHDFSRVQVHTGADAEQSARDVSAHAYTVGHNIVFGAEQFAPKAHEGQRLLAHELTHVVQQTGSDEVHTSRAPNLMIQRDLAIESPRPAAVGRVLTPAEMAAAITFNNRVLGSIANSADIIQMIRDVIGGSSLPAVVDEDFVKGVVQWQAHFGLTQDGKLGPSTARPLFREIGAEGVGQGEISRPPRYAPAGPINVAAVGVGARMTHFDMSAEFRSDPVNGIFPSCCEIRQEIQWDAAYVAANVAAGVGAVPHGGFPAAHPADTWIEDRDTADSRYGWRTGAHSDPGPGDQYLDIGRRQNQAFGHIYEGEDNPTDNPPYAQGSWRFRLGAYDMCKGNRLLQYSPTLVVNWL